MNDPTRPRSASAAAYDRLEMAFVWLAYAALFAMTV
jgi:hypothetical protein